MPAALLLGAGWTALIVIPRSEPNPNATPVIHGPMPVGNPHKFVAWHNLEGRKPLYMPNHATIATME